MYESVSVSKDESLWIGLFCCYRDASIWNLMSIFSFIQGQSRLNFCINHDITALHWFDLITQTAITIAIGKKGELPMKNTLFWNYLLYPASSVSLFTELLNPMFASTKTFKNESNGYKSNITFHLVLGLQNDENIDYSVSERCSIIWTKYSEHKIPPFRKASETPY